MRAFFFRAMAAAVIGAAVLAAAGEARAQTSPVIYRFKGGKDGANPHASLIDVGGTLYGTTTVGGGTGCGGSGCGTVFKMTLNGDETARYPFAGGSSNGAAPYGDVIDVAGTLYGTTQFGGGTGCVGGKGCGTVFKVTAKGVETVYPFKGGKDGAYPVAGLTDVGGTLYGTTEGGGTGCGTVFTMTLTPKVIESVKSFQGGSNAQTNGNTPLASLIYAAGLELPQAQLYGTTALGGNTDYCGGTGCGTVFVMAPGALEPVQLYRLTGETAGAFPYARLTAVGSSLYGTTANGGGTGCGGDGCGTVFEVRFYTGEAAGTTRYRFQGGSGGALPAAGLINVGGTLYGTTAYGGGKGSCINGGCGTVFKVTLTPKVVVSMLYSFKGGSDGANPFAGLINVSPSPATKLGTLYGTTYAGGGTGCGGSGCGTVFKVRP